MTWPPAELPIDFENATPQENTHPDAHNTTNQTINADLVPEINRVGALADTIGLYLPLTGGTLTGDLQVDGSLYVQGSYVNGSYFRSDEKGTASWPTFSFSSYPNTGMFNLNGNDVGLSAGGSLALLAHPSYIYSYKPNIGVNGSLTAPTYSFQSDTNTGMFRYAEDQLGFTVGGGLSALHQVQGTYLYKPQRAQDGTRAEPTYSFQYDTDTGFHRAGNNAIEFVGNGKRLMQLGIGAEAGILEGAWMPTINTRTIGYAGNVHIDTNTAQEGALYRSTASRAFMQEIEAVNLDATNSVYDLQPIWFRSKCDGDNLEHSHYGLAAEDCAAVDPRLAIMATDADGVETADNVNTNAVIALLVSAVQEQRATISDLTARVEALEANA